MHFQTVIRSHLSLSCCYYLFYYHLKHLYNFSLSLILSSSLHRYMTHHRFMSAMYTQSNKIFSPFYNTTFPERKTIYTHVKLFTFLCVWHTENVTFHFFISLFNDDDCQTWFLFVLFCVVFFFVFRIKRKKSLLRALQHT